jgi:hypothetical protein
MTSFTTLIRNFVLYTPSRSALLRTLKLDNLEKNSFLGRFQMPKASCTLEHSLEGYHLFDEVGKVYNPSVYPLEIFDFSKFP